MGRTPVVRVIVSVKVGTGAVMQQPSSKERLIRGTWRWRTFKNKVKHSTVPTTCNCYVFSLYVPQVEVLLLLTVKSVK